ncbi:carbohydrate-binding module family 18 protein [Didymella exigua CBS 183.55]|uniref:Carbohydrate-binding module family 18 protein n=1 Tax=Didymella exigua CBS 183.55 TaxID=1150837 RepID=A0A6A5R7E4_9PLEO|nr:carbohydrate-binding module family 18 protein [Didymella exigua CBS 183.55]KAF1923130.1 carbohydrate-binding module family 18 protein [Didymella exigua CBS 183.55]
MACRFGSPDLVTSLSGVAALPTFAFDVANSNYLGIVGSFTSNNGAACSFPTRYVTQQRTSTYAITPVIVTVGRTTTCSILAPSSITPSASGSTTYSGFECPSITDNQFAPGTYTLRFDQPNVADSPTISSRTFIVALPTFSTDRMTTTVFSTATAPITTTPIITSASTSTVTITGPLRADQTVTQIVASPATATITLTNIIRFCAATAETSSTSSASSRYSSPVSSPTDTIPVSNNGECGSASGQTCFGSTFGSCCSLYGYCGSSEVYCLNTEGCQSGFGECTTSSSVSSSSPPTPTSTEKVSLDGTCGGDNDYVCPESGLGDCCSPYGWCGSSESHCGAGCQNAFGICSNPTPIGTAPLPTSTLRVSLDGACGGTTGQTCSGSTFGTCCSEYGYCGSTDIYCTGACQPTFGTCNNTPAKRSAPKGNLRAASYAAVKRSAGQMQEKRAIGGAGPDYTYPPILRTTVTSTFTQGIIIVPTGGEGATTIVTIVATTTVLPPPASTATVIVTSLVPIQTETVRSTQTVCATST